MKSPIQKAAHIEAMLSKFANNLHSPREIEELAIALGADKAKTMFTGEFVVFVDGVRFEMFR